MNIKDTSNISKYTFASVQVLQLLPLPWLCRRIVHLCHCAGVSMYTFVIVHCAGVYVHCAPLSVCRCVNVHLCHCALCRCICALCASVSVQEFQCAPLSACRCLTSLSVSGVLCGGWWSPVAEAVECRLEWWRDTWCAARCPMWWVCAEELPLMSVSINTFSAVGFGHDNTPFLSMQQNDWKHTQKSADVPHSNVNGNVLLTAERNRPQCTKLHVEILISYKIIHITNLQICQASIF